MLYLLCRESFSGISTLLFIVIITWLCELSLILIVGHWYTKVSTYCIFLDRKGWLREHPCWWEPKASNRARNILYYLKARQIQWYDVKKIIFYFILFFTWLICAELVDLLYSSANSTSSAHMLWPRFLIWYSNRNWTSLLGFISNTVSYWLTCILGVILAACLVTYFSSFISTLGSTRKLAFEDYILRAFMLCGIYPACLVVYTFDSHLFVA